MASQDDVLKVLSEREGAVSAKEVAEEIKATRATVTTLLGRLKKRGFVEGSGTEWLITDNGTAQIDGGTVIPTTTQDVGLDELSKFKYHGQLTGIEHDRITAGAELFKEGDMRSMSHFDNTMATMTVPPTQRTFWRGLYLSFLRSSTPEENRDQAYPLPVPPPPTEPGSGPGVTVIGEAVKTTDPQEFTVDGFNIHRAGAGLGEFTWKEALQAVAAKRGTTPQPAPAEAGSSFLEFAKAIKELSPDPTQPLTADGIIDLLSKLDGLRGQKDGNPPQGYFIDQEGTKHTLAPGEPIVIKQSPPPAPAPGKSYFLNPQTNQLEEIEPGKPIIITVKEGGSNGGSQVPFPVFGQDGQPVYDKDGKPIVADLQPMMKWMGFQADQKRAGERHDSLIGLVKVVKDNVADGISALKVAADEIRHGETSTPARESKEQVYECGDCHTQFKVPAGEFGAIACPGCKREYSKDEVQS